MPAVICLLLASALWLGGQAPSPDQSDVNLLTRIRKQMLANLERQPNYTCVETVERTRHSGAGRKLEMQDKLRLEVALVDGNEIFAKPGSRKFEETDLRVFIPDGAFGNGNFALHARAIFGEQGVTFQHGRASIAGGKSVVRYDYAMPARLSGYRIRISEREATVGYHGAIYADPTSLDVRRIEVIADDIPAEFDLLQASDAVDYQRVQIGGNDFLLPVHSQLIMTDRHQQENRNEVRFEDCHLFTGESKLSFDDPLPESGAPSAVVREVELPGNLELSVSLLEELDLGETAVGDPVRAGLQLDLRNGKELLFPKGSITSGRITRMERWPGFIVVGLVFTEIASERAHAQLNLKLQSIANQRMWMPQSRVILAIPPRAGEAVITMREGMRKLPRIRTVWRT